MFLTRMEETELRSESATTQLTRTRTLVPTLRIRVSREQTSVSALCALRPKQMLSETAVCYARLMSATEFLKMAVVATVSVAF